MADQSNPTFPMPAPDSDNVEQVARDLKKLLANDETRRLSPEVRDDIARLSDWADTYIQGLDAGRKLSEAAPAALTEAQKELQLAYEQFLRLEDEGGNVASPAQQKHTDDLSRALRRLHGLIPAVQTLAGGDPEPEMEPPEQAPGVLPEITPPLENPTTPPDVQPDIPPVIDPKM